VNCDDEEDADMEILTGDDKLCVLDVVVVSVEEGEIS